ncbi:hypothetical protein SAMN05216516_105137 [Izhakiella capsodis]|uniref:Type 1 fimbrial protein n=1 Tax=Izhakiella capsodis TaxID=1367852 RepID=A0A1I4Y2L9_9GAMM|nr:hypothetical protein [Izhakiella capsodis]SFN31739.1 hypothetical protein SAMN05216516_105137 [Izhakiella capsodis]
MKLIAIRILCTALAFVNTNTVLASSGEIGHGIIHFTGSIVEPVCEISHTDTHISSHCMRDGKTAVKTVSIAAADRTLPAETGQVETTWLNPERTLAIMTVSYN